MPSVSSALAISMALSRTRGGRFAIAAGKSLADQGISIGVEIGWANPAQAASAPALALPQAPGNRRRYLTSVTGISDNLSTSVATEPISRWRSAPRPCEPMTI